MIVGNNSGFIASAKSSNPPLDIEWKFWDNAPPAWQCDPLLKITGL